MQFFPLALALAGQRCLLVGGGQTALRKARLLQKSGAQLRIVAAEIDSALQLLDDDAELLFRDYQSTDCRAVALVIAATEDRQLNRQIAADARAAGIWVNAVDDLQSSTIIFPALVERAPLWFAIGSDGKAPILSRWWRKRLNELVPEHFGRVAGLIAEFRNAVSQRLGSGAAHRFWERMLSGTMPQKLLRGDTGAARRQILQALDQPEQYRGGEVWLVGAGPGDPDLLTVRALQLMQQADIVLFDRLVSKEVLERIRRDAIRIHVGKATACHPVSQNRIHTLLIQYARSGKKVMRLKGGDPFFFGRGGEELATLKDSKIPFQVVPGINAASGCASYAGIALTHRRLASSVAFYSAHPVAGRLQLPWQQLMDENQTLVFFMSTEGLAELCRQLIASGRSSSTPAAIVAQGTTSKQRAICASLGDLPDKARDAGIQPPAITIVGRVVTLANDLSWRLEATEHGKWQAADGDPCPDE